MKYRLLYRMVKRQPDPNKGTPGESLPTFRLSVWMEDMECNNPTDRLRICERMKELELEHKENVKFATQLPQSIIFFPMQKIA